MYGVSFSKNKYILNGHTPPKHIHVDITIYSKHIHICGRYLWFHVWSLGRMCVECSKRMFAGCMVFQNLARALLYITFNKHMLPISINMTILWPLCGHILKLDREDFTLLFMQNWMVISRLFFIWWYCR